MTRKQDISELLELARKLSLHTAKWGHDDLYFQSFSDYENALSPDKMIALLEYVERLEKLIKEIGEYSIDGDGAVGPRFPEELYPLFDRAYRMTKDE